MIESRSESYKAAGVDVVAGYEAVKLMKPHVESTFTKGVIGTLGGFGGLFAPDFKGMQEAGTGFRHRRRGHQAQAGLPDEQA